ncbi:MAG: YheU family protein [Myxococcales bacterium]|nr:YheU family protein [Myxococcales bacterium]
MSEPTVVPWRDLSPQALQAVIEEFVLREGTDYGPGQYDLAAKVQTVRAQLERGEAVLTWHPGSQSTSIEPAKPRR